MFAVIMAGGSGKRFWPFSRSLLPKQFLKITGNDTMLEQTLTRLDGLISPEDRVLVINEEHYSILENDERLRPSLILTEPLGKNTAPCIGLAAIHLYLRSPCTPVAVLPADHYIPDTENFKKTLLCAMPLAKEGYIVTIGIIPTMPETGYGYIWRGEKIDKGPLYRVKRFVEKPDLNKAIQYLENGEYFWNGGIFIFTPAVILEEISIHLPDLYNKLENLKSAISTDKYRALLEELYKSIESVSIDYGIMEKTKRPVAVMPAQFIWSDVGSWESLFELNSPGADSHGNILEGKGLLLDTKKSYICNKTDKFSVVLGMENILVVNTDDVLLVTELSKSQRVQEIIEILKERDLKKYL